MEIGHIDGEEFVIHRIDDNLPTAEKSEILNRLKEFFPRTKIIVITDNGKILTYNPGKG